MSETDIEKEANALEGIGKRPWLIDKETYIKIDFIGKIGDKLIG